MFFCCRCRDPIEDIGHGVVTLQLTTTTIGGGNEEEVKRNATTDLEGNNIIIPPANCGCGWVYCFHVVRPSDHVCACVCP